MVPFEQWGRVITAMVTPFDEQGEVDYARAAELAWALIGNGSDSLAVAGTTGESPTLSDQEKLRLLQTVKETVGDRVAVLAGTGSYNTQESIHLSREAQRLGADGLLLVCPYYNRPSQEGLYRHFASIAERVEVPILLYNIPGRTAVNLEPPTLARLAKIGNIVAIKEANNSIGHLNEVFNSVPEGFRIYSGDDIMTLPLLSMGGYGIVSVASHLIGNDIQQMIRSYLEGRVEEAAQLHRRMAPLFKALFVTTNPVPIKTALNLVGQGVGSVRPPLAEMTPAEKEVLLQAMRQYGLLGSC